MIEYVAFGRKTFGAGERIFAEGDRGDVAYLVERGKVAITKAGPQGAETLGVLEHGGLFGEMALIDDRPRMATATAQETTEVHVVPRKEFVQRLQVMDSVMIHILHIMMGRTRELAELLIENRQQKGTPAP